MEGVKSQGSLKRVDSVDLAHMRMLATAKLKRVDSLDLARLRLEHCHHDPAEKRKRRQSSNLSGGDIPDNRAADAHIPRDNQVKRRTSFSLIDRIIGFAENRPMIYVS